MNLSNQKQELMNEKQKLEKLINEMQDNTLFGDTQNHTSEKYSSSELSSYDNHIADIGTDVYMQDMQNSLMYHEKYKLDNVKNALNKIENGTYGVCDKCSCKIEEDRLEIIPEANMCMACSSMDEGKNEYMTKNNQNRIDKPISFYSEYLTDLTDMNKVTESED